MTQNIASRSIRTFTHGPPLSPPPQVYAKRASQPKSPLSDNEVEVEPSGLLGRLRSRVRGSLQAGMNRAQALMTQRLALTSRMPVVTNLLTTVRDRLGATGSRLAQAPMVQAMTLRIGGLGGTAKRAVTRGVGALSETAKGAVFEPIRLTTVAFKPDMAMAATRSFATSLKSVGQGWGAAGKKTMAKGRDAFLMTAPMTTQALAEES
jgi:hypothetical protein